MRTPLRNIHVRPQPAPEAEEITLPRERRITNDPAREFVARPGAVRGLPNEIAALILARQEFREVTRNGITIDGRTFWHENSITIATKAGTKERVLITYNRHQPEVIHVLTNDGAYIESIPQKGKAEFFDPQSTARELGAVRRDQARVMNRLAELHGPDAMETLQRERANLGQMQRSVSTFDSPDAPDRETAPTISRNNPARQIARAESRMQKAVVRDQKQKAKHERTIRRHGAAAARDLLSDSEPTSGAGTSGRNTQPVESTSDAGADLLSVLAGSEQ